MNNNWNRNQMRGSYKGGGGRGHGRGRGSGGSWPSRGFRGSNNRFDRGGRSGQNFERNVNQQWTPRPKPELPSKRLSEQEIFVTEYISDHEGFNGIIKTRFSDFQVSEINMKGEVAKLTDLSPPEAVKEDNEVEDDEDLLLKKYNLEILPMETWDKINKLAINIDSSVEKVEIDVTGMTKQERTKIHDAVKKAFGESIVGSTVTVDDKKYVTFDKYRKGVRVDNRVKWLWPGEYVHFVMYKENLDTMEAASRIAERLRLIIRPSMLGYCGTKDRRAKTSQWFSLRKVDPRKIALCNDLRDIRVGNYSFADHPLKLGMLKGNVFKICLRNVTASDECIDNACSLLEKNGFVNYYGLQRFGTRVELPTYEIGRKLLQGKFREAINVILGTSEWHRLRPRPHSPEARLLSVLGPRPNDLLSALDQLPRNSRLLYVHAYQSLVWNRAASRRLATRPREPAPGDLVALHAPDDLLDDDDIDEHSDEEDEEIDEIDKKETEQRKKEKKVEVKKQIAVKVVTQDDIDNNSFTIFDIVLPLPGHSVIYPPNMKDFYESVLAEDGLTLDMKHKYKRYSLPGGYRRVVAAARGVRWRPARYRDPRADLLLSDLDRLQGRTDDDTGVVEDGKYKALLLTMSLPPSCYATMALRELLRVDTSSDKQALQNNYHRTETNTRTRERNNSNRSNKSDSNIDHHDGNIDNHDGNVDQHSGNIDHHDGNNDQRDGNIDHHDGNIGDCDNKYDRSGDQNESFEESAGDKRKISDSDDAVDSKKAKQDD